MLTLPKTIPSVYTESKEHPPKGWELVFQENEEELRKISYYLKRYHRNYL